MRETPPLLDHKTISDRPLRLPHQAIASGPWDTPAIPPRQLVSTVGAVADCRAAAEPTATTAPPTAKVISTRCTLAPRVLAYPRASPQAVSRSAYLTTRWLLTTPEKPLKVLGSDPGTWPLRPVSRRRDRHVRARHTHARRETKRRGPTGGNMVSPGKRASRPKGGSQCVCHGGGGNRTRARFRSPLAGPRGSGSGATAGSRAVGLGSA